MPMSQARQAAQARSLSGVPPGALTPVDFLDRFSFQQMVAIETAAEANASVRVVDKLLGRAHWVDPADPKTAAMLDALMAAVPSAFGATDADRQRERARILAPPP